MPISRFLFFFLAPALLAAQDVSPARSYEEVVRAFFQRYEVQSPASIYLRLECRPDGYYVARMEDGYTVEERSLFCPYRSDDYKRLDLFPERKNRNGVEEADAFLEATRYEAEEFRRQPYYGYPGWFRDVIELLEGRERLSSWSLQALARAYQSAQVALLGIGTLPDTADQIPLPSGQNALSPAVLQQYLEWYRLKMAAYHRLRQQQPDFMTPVGPIGTKCSNEVMDAFLNLSYFQNETTARGVLEHGLYDDYMLESARNMLRSCPTDAVLLTWGDSDTYPLYYVQAMEGFRCDVIVANLSLLVLPRYNAWLRSGPLGARPLQTLLPDYFFRDLLVLRREDGGQIVADSFFHALADTTAMLRDPFGNVHLPLTFNELLLPVPNSVHPLIWSAGESTLLPDVITQVDFLVANQWSRPLCFAMTGREQSFHAWRQHLQLEGLVYRVYPDNLPAVNNIGDGQVNLDRGYRLWEDTLQFTARLPVTDFDRAPYFQTSWLAGVSLAMALVEAGDTTKARQVALRLSQRFPQEMRVWDYNWIGVSRLLAQCGEEVEAERLAMVILDNYRTGKTDAWKVQARTELCQLAEEYGWKKLQRASCRRQ